MRIVSEQDIDKLGKQAQSQIRKHLVKNKTSRPSKTPSQTGTRVSDKIKSPSNSDKHGKTDDGNRFCYYPSPDPFVKLHTLLDCHFGRYCEGGYHASEVILPGHDIRFRYDYALLPWKVFIESDGFGPHRDKESFNRDRQKQTHALKNGWLLHRITVRDVFHRFDNLLPDIERILSHRPRHDVSLKPVGKCYYEVV